MTMCEQCGKHAATVHVTEIASNVSTLFHLCEDCAREKGVPINQEPDKESLPQTVLSVNAGMPVETRECSHCHMKFSEFAIKGLLGCSFCYEDFEKDIDAMLLQMHGSIVHKGKRCSTQAFVPVENADIEKLRAELTNAITREEFELAVLLRDSIRKISNNIG